VRRLSNILWPGRSWSLPLIALGLVIGACSSPDISGGVAPTPRFEASSEGVTFDAAGLVASAEAREASPEQVEYLRDGLLTFAEYERAIQESLGCAIDRGIPVVELGVKQDSDGFPRVDYAVPSEVEGLSEDEVLEIFDSCYAAHAGIVDGIWQIGNSSNADPEVFRSRLAALAACLNENGVPTAEGGVTNDNLDQAITAAIELSGGGGPDCVQIAGLR